MNLKLLQDLSSSLIDLHQQFDTLDLHQVSFQLRTLDALANDHKKLIFTKIAFSFELSAKKQMSDTQGFRSDIRLRE